MPFKIYVFIPLEHFEAHALSNNSIGNTVQVHLEYEHPRDLNNKLQVC